MQKQSKMKPNTISKDFKILNAKIDSNTQKLISIEEQFSLMIAKINNIEQFMQHYLVGNSFNDQSQLNIKTKKENHKHLINTSNDKTRESYDHESDSIQSSSSKQVKIIASKQDINKDDESEKKSHRI